MGAPIVLKTATTKEGMVSPPRSTVKQTFDRVKQDLNTAIERLNRTTSTTLRARFNLYAAKALLSRVYLYTGEWDKVIPLCNDVIAAGASNYALIPGGSL